ncbi:methionyl-tRNA formyltransferase, mitochondrial-like [Teratosphaeria destructans]|uniref:methionyl-tRNA formyltransferase n=1 Tax=Teratosphaeria destructans TaxID=418781 RepID=A0A9W7VXM4_9PEZI|nr:methionyl-tRNA formyltransferase, mitochondrial-like [Teratosphaeria destructans]
MSLIGRSSTRLIAPCISGRRQRRPFTTSKQYDPLGILFCGADDFSIYSLKALFETKQHSSNGKIASIDIVCRPGKRVGRGMKQIRNPPIQAVAKDLGLPLHELDTFTGWRPPGHVNLVVAVSFGLLVPSRILNGAQYGGLNIHPSLLPELRGSAPIQHALLQRKTKTGVSLQTMHPMKFDHGTILDQVVAEVKPESNYSELVHQLGPMGAQMLARGIDHGIFVEPLEEVKNDIEPSYAPKLTAAERQIDWQMWTSDELLVRDRVLGKLSDFTTYDICREPSEPPKRVTFDGPWTLCPHLYAEERKRYGKDIIGLPLPVHWHDNSNGWLEARPGHRWGQNDHLGICTIDGSFAIPAHYRVEGETRKFSGYMSKLSKLLVQRLNDGEIFNRSKAS